MLTVKQLIEYLKEKDGNLYIDVIQYNDNAENTLTLDVYDYQTGESFLEYINPDEDLI